MNDQPFRGNRNSGRSPVLLTLAGMVAGVLFALPIPSAARGDVLGELTQWEEGRSRCASSARPGKDGLPDPNQNADSKSVIEPGATAVLADLQGPGIIQHIWMTIYHFQPLRAGWAPQGRANPQELLIRIYWDGREKPDVEAPLGDFFAAGFGRQMTVESMPVVTEDGDSYNCYWRMPFQKSARIEVINQSKKPVRMLYYAIDWEQKKSLPPDTMYFCAQYRQEYPVRGNPDRFDNEYVILNAEGKGYFVGTVLSVRTRSPDWFGEGDLRISIDGEEKPSIWGTGTEDYFLSAWGQKVCNTPYFGNPFVSHKHRDVGQMSCCYRWHIRDRIVFSKSIRVAIETMGWLDLDENTENKSRVYGQRQDDWASVAYWYQAEPTKKFAEPTTAEQRKLPSIDRVIAWGADHRDRKYHGRGHTERRNSDRYHDTEEVRLFLPESKEEGWFEFPLEVNEKEPLRLVLILGRSPQGGIYQPIFDDVKMGEPIDLYNPERDTIECQLMDFWPEPGEYVLRLECVGRNHLSDNYEIGVNSVRLRQRRPRVKEIGYLKDHDWRAQPVLIERTTEPLKNGQ